MHLTKDEQSTIHSTFSLERSYPVTPDRVFAAFADPATKRQWFIAGASRDVEQYELNFRVGGAESARTRIQEGPVKGLALSSEGIHLDIVPDRRIVIASRMAIEGRPISAALATFELLASESGTDLIFTHQCAFFEGADGPEMREAGWRRLLDRLAEAV